MINKKIFEKILLVFDAIVIIYALIVIYRFALLTNLEKKGSGYLGKTNYKIEQESFQEGYIHKYYEISDGKQLIGKNIMVSLDTGTSKMITQYVSNDQSYTQIYTSENKEYYSWSTLDNSLGFGYGNLQLDFKEKLIISVLGQIHKTTYDFKDAYYINLSYAYDYNYDKIIVDKDTGLIVEQKNNQLNTSTDNEYEYIKKFKYEFDTVKDGEIKKTDQIGYKEIKNNN